MVRGEPHREKTRYAGLFRMLLMRPKLTSLFWSSTMPVFWRKTDERGGKELGDTMCPGAPTQLGGEKIY